jgi:hypothetical protein
MKWREDDVRILEMWTLACLLCFMFFSFPLFWISLGFISKFGIPISLFVFVIYYLTIILIIYLIYNYFKKSRLKEEKLIRYSEDKFLRNYFKNNK